MGALGVVETIGAVESFTSENVTPTLPGVRATGVGSSSKLGSRLPDSEAVAAIVAANLEETLRAARARVDLSRTSTTLAALAQALEMNGDDVAAITTAEHALDACRASGDGLVDPSAARIALGVLLRNGAAESGLSRARVLPISSHLRLVVGALLGDQDRLAEAHEFVDSVDVPERDSVLGFLALKEGNNQRAVACLRAALRRAPDDADSAFNLSIALWRLGSRRKALSAARQSVASAPGRIDVAYHYYQLLFAEKDYLRVDREIQALLDEGVVAPGRLLITRARAVLALGDYDRALKILRDAGEAAQSEGDEDTAMEVRSNIVRLRAQHGDVTRDASFAQLLAMHRENLSSSVIVANLAQVAYRKRHSAELRKAFHAVQSVCPPERAELLEYTVATLEGDNLKAAEHAQNWLRLDPSNPVAASAAIVAIGIGAERWQEAADLALDALSADSENLNFVNNAAYALAMAGDPHRAIELLEPVSEREFVLKATLGLACLAAKDVSRGMRLYREAAAEAERQKDVDSCGLMASYQALVVRQLGISETANPLELAALAIAPVPIPEDWDDRPEYLRLKFVADKHGYGWPLSL